MILLLGGTGETGEISSALARDGFDILVSTATDYPLKLLQSRRINIRTGRLSESEMTELIRDMNIEAVVDITHPYALEITDLAVSVSSICGLPYYRYYRPTGIQKAPDIFFAKDHATAAVTAFSFGSNVLLTVGSKNLAPYVKEARQVNSRIVVRVLDTEDSIRACLDARIDRESIVTGKGPFSVENNIAAIRNFNIGVLVTKDGGVRGGVLEKLEASRAEGCRIVVVARADNAYCEDRTWVETGKLLDAIKRELRS
jgi:precorrin-6A/cobalt-precorrin-6A reductase